MMKKLFFAVIVYPFTRLILGLNVQGKNRHRLPMQGPAIIIANHNSHLDTAVLMSLFPFKTLPYVRPVAADDYWNCSWWISWFARHCIGIIPIKRRETREAAEIGQAIGVIKENLDQGNIVIYYPEGTRGRPEELNRFKKGIFYLAQTNPTVPIIPVFLHGLGKAWPKGEPIFVPFICHLNIGEGFSFQDLNPSSTPTKEEFLALLEEKMQALRQQLPQRPPLEEWDPFL